MTSIGAVRSDRKERLQVGLGVGAVAGAIAAGPTIVTGSTKTMFIKRATFGSMGLGLGMAAGMLGERGAQALDAHTGLNRWQSHAVETGLGVAALVATHGHGELSNVGGAARSLGMGLAAAGSAGLAIDGYHALRHDQAAGSDTSNEPSWARKHWKVLALGGAVAAAGVAFLGYRFVHGQLANSKNLAPLTEASKAEGVKLGELVPREKVNMPGRLFLEGRTKGLPTEPVRAVVPFHLDGMTMQQRNAHLVDSLVKQGAFQRDHIVVAATTGTGSFNPSVIELDERLSKGNSAWISFQYSDKPSIFSLGKTDDGAAQFTDLAKQIAAKKRELFPQGGGPKLQAAATSLGADVIHRALEHDAATLFGPEVDLHRILLFGSPEQLTKFGPASLPAGQVIRVHDSAALKAITQDQATKAKVIEFAHEADPIRVMDFSSAWKQPQYLRAAVRPDGVPKGQHFLPGITLLQQASDVVGSITASSSPALADHWHDYRTSAQYGVRAFSDNWQVTNAEVDAAAKLTQQHAKEAAEHMHDVLKGVVGDAKPAGTAFLHH
jgi:hypothetical protein